MPARAHTNGGAMQASAVTSCPRLRVFLPLVLACVLGLGFGSASAQTPLPNPDLDLLTNGIVDAMVRQADGSLVIAGYFTSVNGVPRHGLARLRSDRSLDLDWDPSPDYWANALAIDGNGNLYIGGNFTVIGGAPHPSLVRMVGTSNVVDPQWTACCFSGDAISAIAIDRNWVYVGGYLGGRHLERFPIDDSTSLTPWHGQADGYVRKLVLDGYGALYAAGEFNYIGGTQMPHVAKLSARTGDADALWRAAIPDLAVGTTYALATEADRAVYVGGTFGLYQLSTANGSRLRRWVPSTGTVGAVAPAADGSVYVGGTFDAFGGRPRENLARVSAIDGLALPDWQPTANAGVSKLALAPDGSIDIAGAFSEIDGVDRMGLARLKSPGQLDAARSDVERPGSVLALAVQPDGGVIVGGDFVKANQIMRKHILRLAPEGTLDPQWAPALSHPVFKIAADADRYVYASVLVGWQDSHRLSRVQRVANSANGAVDLEWSAEANDWIASLAVDHEGRPYVGGSFTSINGVARPSIARLSVGSGDPDASWDATADCCSVNAIAVGPADEIYVGGDFTRIDGMPRQSLARLSAISGAADPSWNPGAAGIVYALAVDSHADVYAGGKFWTIGGQNRWNIAKLRGDGNGEVYAGWNANMQWINDLGADLNGVWAFTLDANDTVYVNGYFGVLGAWPYERSLARFSGAYGLVDVAWHPGDRSYYYYALAVSNERIYIGGDFQSIGGAPRIGLAAFPVTLPDRLFATDFEIYSP
jgi:hypothetical protein